MAQQTLAGKVALVTGGGQGVGLGIAQALAIAGAALVITGRDAAKLEAAARDLATLGGAGVAVYAGDVRQRADADAAIAVALERFGQLDVLVNNAQSSKPGTLLEDIDDDAIALTLESGLLGTIRHMQAAFPHLKARGGSIINLGSREGIYGGIGFGIYAATKEGVRGVSRVAAREWGRYGIRVNVICPAALSPVAIQYLDAHPEQAEMYRKEIALGRFGDPHADIGPVAVFLAGDDSRYITGQTINADGGQVML
ncbi:SDR family oxidoreductase [Nitrospirillum sp. BR 11164]|uniref:SDR family NAD(P)-dependent oxidoreductase n=1 Tax=Nitrospirillum sp. BR 11164 TaxID=3104324 RepID=UPI002AFDD446|nr:SDR family oxidoreductase [Nitrospirillum sp. BR 11164]MEA1652840.1 SDR family oxidoreductase [Nitrospirillum sp. BR 11164]